MTRPTTHVWTPATPAATPPEQVVIIGAGWSGMAAADSLARAGNVSFVVLESSNRTGGPSLPTIASERTARALGASVSYYVTYM